MGRVQFRTQKQDSSGVDARVLPQKSIIHIIELITIVYNYYQRDGYFDTKGLVTSKFIWSFEPSKCKEWAPNFCNFSFFGLY